MDAQEKPIIFSTEMVQAILDGRKTETRRVINPQPEEKMKEDWPDFDGEIYQLDLKTPDGQKLFGFCTAPKMKEGELFGSMKSRYGNPGDLLYVRETFGRVKEEIIFKTSVRAQDVDRWKPSIHMKKIHSRIWLRVKEVSVERVQDINYEGIVREGISFQKHAVFAAVEFENLWNSINESRGYGWKNNPWVWCISFEVVSTDGRPG